MKQKVLLSITGTQTVNGDTDSTQMQTTGYMTVQNGKYYLTYQETQATGVPECTTVIKVDGEHKVSLQRFGPFQSLLIMEKGRRHQCLYGTPEGDLTIGIFTHFLETSLRDDGGEIHVAYSLDVNTALASENRVDISVKLV